jgi:putative flippase GtrA
VRFGIVGISNTLLTLASFALLTAAGLAPPPASAIAFGIGALNGYLLNRSWTFRGGRRGPRTVARYVAVQALGAGFSAAGVALAVRGLDLGRLPAEALVLPVVTLLTYTLSRTVVFGVSEPA